MDQRKTIYLCALVTAVCMAFLMHYLLFIWRSYLSQTPGHPPIYGDFFALWSYAQLTNDHPMVELYDYGLTHARQIALGMDPGEKYPFPYPPMFAFMVWPLCLVQYEMGYLLLMLGSLALFMWVVWTTCSRQPFCLFGLIISPATMATIFAGQTGFLAAALMTAGIRLAGSRPVVAGVLFGVLSYKPQLGLLVPVALIAARLWVALGAACVTVAGLAAAATLAFGWHVWRAWLAMMPAYSEWFDSVQVVWPIRPTVTANLQMLGVALPWARGIQLVVAGLVAIVVWNCFRRNAGPLSAAALLVGSALAAPHAFFYDLPIVCAGMVLLIEDRTRPGQSFSTTEVLSLLLAMMFPALMVLPETQFPISTIALSLLLFVIVRRQGEAKAQRDQDETERVEAEVVGDRDKPGHDTGEGGHDTAGVAMTRGWLR